MIIFVTKIMILESTTNFTVIASQALRWFPDICNLYPAGSNPVGPMPTTVAFKNSVKCVRPWLKGAFLYEFMTFLLIYGNLSECRRRSDG